MYEKIVKLILIAVVYLGCGLQTPLMAAAASAVCAELSEEFGSCTIVASPAGAVLDPSCEGYRPCSLGRVEISWRRKPCGEALVMIDHLEVNPKCRAKGLGALLFNEAVHFTLRYFTSIPSIAWKAQPLERTMTLERLISFYEKLGGEVVCVLDASCAKMRLSDAAIATAQDFIAVCALCDGWYALRYGACSNGAAGLVISMRDDINLSMKNFRVATSTIRSEKVVVCKGGSLREKNFTFSRRYK